MEKIIILVSLLLFFCTCVGVKKNISMRKNLENCKYEFHKLEINKINTKGLKIITIGAKLYLRITNTTQKQVALDKIEGDIFLDKQHAAEFTHKHLVIIKPGQSSIEPLSLSIPFQSIIKSIGHKPKTITIKSKLFMNIVIGSTPVGSPIAIKIEKSFPVPYTQLKKMIKKKMKRKLF